MGYELKKTVVLVGMMGAGKTAVGRALARGRVAICDLGWAARGLSDGGAWMARPSDAETAGWRQLWPDVCRCSDGLGVLSR